MTGANVTNSSILINANGGVFDVTGANFTNNIHTSDAGTGMIRTVNGGATTNIANTEFSSNTISGSKVAILSIDNANLNLVSSALDSNLYADALVRIENGSKVVISDSTFENNSSTTSDNSEILVNASNLDSPKYRIQL